jgi:Ca2+:H+ antiporter
MGSQEDFISNNIENGSGDGYKGLAGSNNNDPHNKEQWSVGKTPQNLSSSMVRKKSDPILVTNVRFQMVRNFLHNLQEVILGTKLAVLFPAIPLAIAADFYHFGRVSDRRTNLVTLPFLFQVIDI